MEIEDVVPIARHLTLIVHLTCPIVYVRIHKICLLISHFVVEARPLILNEVCFQVFGRLAYDRSSQLCAPTRGPY
jgi:hypothetical protein